MLLTNGSKYKIFNIEHTIRNNLIIKHPIQITDASKLEKLYFVIKYTTEFLEENNIDYCIESGTLLGCVRHNGIIPWDNDADIMIFKDGYLKMKNLIDKYNNNHHYILHMTPGFRLFYDNESYGELFVYDFDEKLKLYRMAFPYINKDFNDNSNYKPTFITSDLYFNHQKYKKETLFPTKKTIFENFYVRTPNNIIDVLKNTYNGNLLECKYYPKLNNQHESISFNKYRLIAFIEKLTCNKILILIYKLFHWLVSKLMIYI